MPRRIILLSDGTGNSAAKVWRTNVWRLFTALDLRNDDQVACYDDGVGTSSFQPLAILGGAFGFGLRKNVLTLYKFACRNYRAGGAEIFGFGFSRGAFTIRVTIGLILDQGLIPADTISETELHRRAKAAYRAYHKHHFHTNWGLMWIGLKKLFKREDGPRTIPAGRHQPVIRFLGLWDTVAAYGLPVDEMTQGVSQWIVPFEIPSHTLNPLVKRACHALSLDDERTTFHPVLWNEAGQVTKTSSPVRKTSDETISQVWFAGVHANVGGGYPDDSLAHVPLYWIMEESRACGLIFKESDPAAAAEVRQAQDKDGRLYDSRSGIGSYYRYGPRRISWLSHQLFSLVKADRVRVEKPKIHETVLRRIQNNAHLYAPIGIPHNYEIVSTVPDPAGSGATFRIDALPAASTPGALHEYETIEDAQARVLEERRQIWPRVLARTILYFCTLIATIFFASFPLMGREDPLGERLNQLVIVSKSIRFLSGFLPGWAAGWFTSYAQYPKTFLLAVLIVGGLLIASRKLASTIDDRMEDLWRRSLSHSLPKPSSVPSAHPIGRERAFLWLRMGWKDYVAPALSAVIMVYLGITIVGRGLFVVADDAGFVCSETRPLSYIPDTGALVSFPTKSLCFSTGYRIGRLDRYLVWTSPDLAELNAAYRGYSTVRDSCNLSQATVPNKMTNGSVEATARGYSTFHNNDVPELSWLQMVTHVLATPLRRYYFHPWFQPIARYGAIGNEVDFLEPDPNPSVTKISEFVSPKVPGELFFYVNDAVVPLPDRLQWLYGDNTGCISFFVKPSK